MELEQIHQLIQQGQFERALQESFNNIEAHPDEVENYINSGVLLAEAGEIEKAERFFQRALTIKPDNGVIYYNLANVYFNEGRFQEAVKLYQEVLSHHVDHKDTYYMLGLSLIQLDAKKQALPYIMRAAELDAQFEDLEVQFQFALLMCELEMFDQAIPVLNQILERDPQHADAQYNLTLALYMLNENIDVAIQGFERAVQMDSQHLLSQHALKTFRLIKAEEEA
ncbi:tetratricopeptide repeat protein [Staphylococcus pseudintermedius]|uniref:tetratricopeptide repeat protein n=1 Tax=Staphylococcus pseudintermedius TaxID=283734 RepID=UPI0016553FDF|nr:tetratricopeptide repeat protein [Staphylococcus pseudintermedius]MBC8682518.1 tetratricopeptide repeat protein [Staphylococcus pseudintermedius]